jgi:hypothetical protein
MCSCQYGGCEFIQLGHQEKRRWTFFSGLSCEISALCGDGSKLTQKQQLETHQHVSRSPYSYFKQQMSEDHLDVIEPTSQPLPHINLQRISTPVPTQTVKTFIYTSSHQISTPLIVTLDTITQSQRSLKTRSVTHQHKVFRHLQKFENLGWR